MREKINRELTNSEEIEMEALIQVVELAHDYDLENKPAGGGALQ